MFYFWKYSHQEPVGIDDSYVYEVRGKRRTRVDGSEENGYYGRHINGNHISQNLCVKLKRLKKMDYPAFYAGWDISPGEEISLEIYSLDTTVTVNHKDTPHSQTGSSDSLVDYTGNTLGSNDIPGRHSVKEPKSRLKDQRDSPPVNSPVNYSELPGNSPIDSADPSLNSTQILNLRDNELAVLAGILGHAVRMHRELYRLPQDVIQDLSKYEGNGGPVADEGNGGQVADLRNEDPIMKTPPKNTKNPTGRKTGSSSGNRKMWTAEEHAAVKR